MFCSPKQSIFFALLFCCAWCTATGQVSVKSVKSQVQNGQLIAVVTLSRWQGGFTYQLTIPAGSVPLSRINAVLNAVAAPYVLWNAVAMISTRVQSRLSNI